MDLISRRGALQAIARLKSDYDCDYNKIVESCRGAVKRLPTHSEERKGKWINEGQFAPYRGEDIFRCSLCGGHVIEYDTQVYEMNPYCKWCGAKMEADE